MHRVLLIRGVLVEFVRGHGAQPGGARLLFRSDGERVRFLAAAMAADTSRRVLRTLLAELGGTAGYGGVGGLDDAALYRALAERLRSGELIARRAARQFEKVSLTIPKEAEPEKPEELAPEEGSYFYPDLEAEADGWSVEVEVEAEAEPSMLEVEVESEMEFGLLSVEAEGEAEPSALVPEVESEALPELFTPTLIAEVPPAVFQPAVQGRAPHNPPPPPPDPPSFTETTVARDPEPPMEIPDQSPTRWVLRVRVKSARSFWPDKTVSATIEAVSGAVGRFTKYPTMEGTTSDEVVFEGVGTVTWSVSAASTDWEQSSAVQVSVRPDDDKTVEVELTPKHWVSFALQDSAGQTISGSTIRSKLASGRSTTHQPGSQPALLREVREDRDAELPEVLHDTVWEFVEVTSA